MPDPGPIDAYVIDFENLHHIQRDVLSRLNLSPRLAHSALKPAELTGNSFNYHLRHVMAQQLVAQGEDGQYFLTPRGRLLADNVSLPSMKLKIRPVTGVVLLVQSPAAGVLQYESSREPTRALIGLPFGKLRLGDSIEATIERMYRRRRLDSARITNVKCLGQANIRYFEQGELVVHRLASVWSCRYDGDAAGGKTENGRDFWTQSSGKQSALLPEVSAVRNWPAGTISIEISGDLANR
jgi:hypothetical protein